MNIISVRIYEQRRVCNIACAADSRSAAVVERAGVEVRAFAVINNTVVEHAVIRPAPRGNAGAVVVEGATVKRATVRTATVAGRIADQNAVCKSRVIISPAAITGAIVDEAAIDQRTAGHAAAPTGRVP